MSWLARSIVNTLRGDEEEDEEEEEEDDEEEEEARGVKEDLSVLTQTLTRQFRGVASFLAPPLAEPSPSDRDPTALDSPRLAGVRSDLAEIGGRFRTGISLLSSAKAVSEISKIASSLMQFDSSEEEEEAATGVTDDVVAFARNISMHPETWLDFPPMPGDGDSDAFDMSDAQLEHALAVERLAPGLASVRTELCPSNMSERHFWKIYFVLLHSRLDKHDADLLSTPQIIQARAMLQDLPPTKPNSEGPGTISESLPMKAPTHEEPMSSVPITDLETEKHTVDFTEVTIVDKSVVEESPSVITKTRDIQSGTSSSIPIEKYEGGGGDDWLEDETSEAGAAVRDTIPLGNDEDVSFSDLEDYDEDRGEVKVLNARAYIR